MPFSSADITRRLLFICETNAGRAAPNMALTNGRAENGSAEAAGHPGAAGVKRPADEAGLGAGPEPDGSAVIKPPR
eukprot:scaffold648765_cov51-Prasinocladus_malaysianus.AAC.2